MQHYNLTCSPPRVSSPPVTTQLNPFACVALPSPASSNHHSVVCLYECFCFCCSFVYVLWSWFCHIPHMSEIIIIRCLSLSIWLLSLSIIPSRSIHVVLNGKISPLCGWVVSNVYTYRIFFNHPSIDEHIGGFHILAIASNAAMNISMYLSFWISVQLGSLSLSDLFFEEMVSPYSVFQSMNLLYTLLLLVMFSGLQCRDLADLLLVFPKYFIFFDSIVH